MARKYHLPFKKQYREDKKNQKTWRSQKHRYHASQMIGGSVKDVW
jgi:hypothetical protein